MAKRKKKKKRKGGGVGLAGGAMAGAVGNVLGNMLGQLLADGVEQLGARGGKGDSETRDDVAARALKALSERGPQSIAQLLEATGSGLTPLLEALRAVKDFRLVDFVGEGELVQLTQSGRNAVTVVQKGDIREQAQRLLDG